jgi:RNA polymerase sigma-70 factor, ECF subfamily
LKGTWEADRDPLAALQAGDPALFEEFVRMEAATFIGFFRRQGAERAEAEDLAQEVFVKLFRGAPSYQHRGAFAAFALRVARNAWVDRRRRQGVSPHMQSLSDTNKPSVEGGIDRQRLVSKEREVLDRMSVLEESQRLQAALAGLSAAHAMIFELAVVQGLPYSDIAAELDIPIGTVKSRVFNAVRKLRDALEGPATERGGAR